MTIDEFKQTGWTPGMTARYHSDGDNHPVGAVDFLECLVGLLDMVSGDEDKLVWVRCENITLTPPYA